VSAAAAAKPEQPTILTNGTLGQLPHTVAPVACYEYAMLI